jgi:hypothetical protein
MGKSKLRVRRLTLAPNAVAGESDSNQQRDEEAEEERRMLDREHLRRITEVSLIAGEGKGKHTKPHVHGVEPTWGSKFWASGNDDTSTEASDDEDITTPTLMSESLEAGFTVEHLRQAEADLRTPTSSTGKVRVNLSECSISKKIVDAWINNRRNIGKPWCGPLPPPRESPLRTLGDALANAKVQIRRKASHSYATHDHHRGYILPKCSSAQAVNQEGMVPRSDPKVSKGVVQEEVDERSETGVVDERRLRSLATDLSGSKTAADQSGSREHSISNFESNGAIQGVESLLSMRLTRAVTPPGWAPTPGLISCLKEREPTNETLDICHKPIRRQNHRRHRVVLTLTFSATGWTPVVTRMRTGQWFSRQWKWRVPWFVASGHVRTRRPPTPVPETRRRGTQRWPGWWQPPGLSRPWFWRAEQVP